MREKQLLDDLGKTLRCGYLSELCSVQALRQLPDLLLSIPCDAYEVRQWNDAVDYLLKEETIFADSAEAKQYLIEKLRAER